MVPCWSRFFWPRASFLQWKHAKQVWDIEKAWHLIVPPHCGIRVSVSYRPYLLEDASRLRVLCLVLPHQAFGLPIQLGVWESHYRVHLCEATIKVVHIFKQLNGCWMNNRQHIYFAMNVVKVFITSSLESSNSFFPDTVLMTSDFKPLDCSTV